MSQYKNDFDDSQGKPNTSALQYLQEQLTPSVISSIPRVCKTVVSGSAGVEADIPMGAEIIGVEVICLKSNSSGTMMVMTNADTPVQISDAVACVTADAVDYAASIDTTYSVVGADGIAIFGNGAEDYGAVYITYLK
jgi:hypothetical protein